MKDVAKKAVVLARVSTEEQITEGQSIPAQLKRAREYAKLRGLTILAEHEFDESSVKDKRVKFEKVMETIRTSEEPIALIVETADRLQRSFKESVELDVMRKAGKLEIHFIREGLIVKADSNSSEIIRWDMAVMFAKSYVLQIGDNVRRTFDKKVANGEIIGKAPIGYLNVQDEAEKSNVVVDEARASHIVKIFELYSQGNISMAMIAEMSAKWGLVSNTATRRRMKVRDIEHILKNTFYYGMQGYKGEHYPHKYEPLIDFQLFKKCCEVRERYKTQSTKHDSKPFSLKGLVKCAVCGCAVTAEMHKGRLVYYHCTNYRKQHKPVWFKEETLLKEIADVFGKMKLAKKKANEIRAALAATEESKNKFYEQQARQLKAEHSRIEKRVNVMYDDRLDGRITAAEYDKKVQDFKERQQEILFKLQKLDKADESFYLTANQVLSLAERAPEIFGRSKPNEKRDLINLVLSNATLSDEKLLYKVKEPYLALVTANSTSNWGESWELNP